MLLIENLLLAINSLLANKMRALLTMLGIIIGIGSVIAIITVGDSLTLSVSENMQSMGANDIYAVIQPRSSEDEISNKVDGVVYKSSVSQVEDMEDDCITREMIEDLCNSLSDEIYAINSSYSVGTSSVKNGSNTTNTNVQGVTAGYFITNTLDMLAGQIFSAEEFESGKNVILVSSKFVENLFDSDVSKAIGQEIEIAVDTQIEKFTIVGVFKTDDSKSMMSIGVNSTYPSDSYIPMKTAQTFLHKDIKYTDIQIISKVGVDIDSLNARVQNFFDQYYRNNKDFKVNVFTMGAIVDSLTTMLSTITLAISIVAGIALIVGGIGVMNIMLVSVTERTREIGTRKALGAKNSSIRAQFIIEAIIICLVGGIIGVILGISGGILASNMLGYPAQPSIAGIITSLAFSMTIGVFFGYYPANKAAKMNPIDALRYE